MFQAAAVLGALILFSFPSVGFAKTILFQATDIADSTPGEETYDYEFDHCCRPHASHCSSLTGRSGLLALFARVENSTGCHFFGGSTTYAWR